MARAILDRHPDATHALVMLDARRQEVFAALYRRGSDRTGSGPRLLPAGGLVPPITGQDPLETDGIADGVHSTVSIRDRVSTFVRQRPDARIVAAGDGLGVVELGIPEVLIEPDRELWNPDARVLGALALGRWRRNEGVEVISLQPMYHQLAPAEAKVRNFGLEAPMAHECGPSSSRHDAGSCSPDAADPREGDNAARGQEVRSQRPRDSDEDPAAR
jgi:tRNA A37 threonylcarbamoyladenosine modification protein TsaB